MQLPTTDLLEVQPYLLCIAQAAHVIFVAQIAVDHDIRQPPPPPPPGWVWEYWKITSWLTCLVSHFPPQCRSNSTRWMDTLADPVLRIGTATLEDLDPVASLARGNDTSRLKRSKKGVILVPQPSDDPKDPLVCRRQKQYPWSQEREKGHLADETLLYRIGRYGSATLYAASSA